MKFLQIYEGYIKNSSIFLQFCKPTAQKTYICSKSAIETLEKYVKYVQS